MGALGFLLIGSILLSQPRWLFTLAARLLPGAIYAVNIPEIVLEANPQQKPIALTIDDGPSAQTAEILAVLAQHNAKATFFNISSNLESYEAIAQQTVDEGHELGNHLTKDNLSFDLSNQEFEDDLRAAERALLPFVQARQPAARLKWLRPGKGLYSPAMVRTAEKYGYQIVLGSCFPYDTHIPSSRFASKFILSSVQPGDIVVLHDGKDRGDSLQDARGERTVRTLETILPALKEKGYDVTTVSGLMARIQTIQSHA